MTAWTAALVSLYLVGAFYRVVRVWRNLRPVRCSCGVELPSNARLKLEAAAFFAEMRYGMGRKSFMAWSYVISAVFWPALFGLEFGIGFIDGYRQARNLDTKVREESTKKSCDGQARERVDQERP